MAERHGFKATVVADSVAPRKGRRLITMSLRYPRFIHAEFMTHRVFSRNAASSRAIPVAKMIEQVRNDPAMPVFWGKNQPGMQAAEELSGDELALVQEGWKNASRAAANFASDMASNNAHKQIVNRILEPWQWMQTVVTATEWDNFFALRRHKDAQPEIHLLADLMFEAQQESEPKALRVGEWHLPYVNDAERHILTLEQQIKCSVARCARVSYLTHEGKVPNFDEDAKLYERLVGSKPMHASPAEHQATPDSYTDFEGWNHRHLQGNFWGWVQYRGVLDEALDIPHMLEVLCYE